MNKIAILFFSLVVFGNCASTLLPREDRRVEYIVETKLSKKEVYERGLVYLAKSLGIANLAISIRDKENSRIVSSISYHCEKFKPVTYYNTPRNFIANIDLTAKENKYRIIFDDIIVRIRQSENVFPNDKEEFEHIKEVCALPLKNMVVDAIEGKGITTTNDF